MLLSLHIRDFAIIDQLEIELHAGMTALTGETGAGKSILLDALGLLLGDRADSGAVKANYNLGVLARLASYLRRPPPVETGGATGNVTIQV